MSDERDEDTAVAETATLPAAGLAVAGTPTSLLEKCLSNEVAVLRDKLRAAEEALERLRGDLATCTAEGLRVRAEFDQVLADIARQAERTITVKLVKDAVVGGRPTPLHTPVADVELADGVEFGELLRLINDRFAAPE